MWAAPDVHGSNQAALLFWAAVVIWGASHAQSERDEALCIAHQTPNEMYRFLAASLFMAVSVVVWGKTKIHTVGVFFFFHIVSLSALLQTRIKNSSV